MKLKNLILEQYRNYSKTDLTIDPEQQVTCIIGQNAQGKTNILEAIYLLALTKSFRTKRQENLIQWGKDFARVTGVFEEEQGEKNSMELEIFIGNPPQPKRALKKNGVKISSFSFIGNCQMVFFHPEDLNILYLGPDLRRRYMDILNIQINPTYYKALRSYKRIMEQRNSLLKRIKEGLSNPSDLNVWDEQLIEQGSLIMTERHRTTEFINQKITETYKKISKNDDEIQINYQSAYETPEKETDLREFITSSFTQKLQQSREKDLHTHFTTVGPHRDELEFNLNGRPLGEHASRGEYRSIILALKLVELKFYEEKTGEKPILLLDDVFSELDQSRQETLLSSLQGYQSILTSTHLIEYPAYNREHSGLSKSHIEVKEGNIVVQ